MGKFSFTNHVKIDPLAYRVMMLGEPKIGKTTLVKDVLEKLVGHDGYLFLEFGNEEGGQAIEGISRVNCPAWNADIDVISESGGVEDVCEDIIENKATDYPDLKIVVFDTYDNIIPLAEQEAIDLWNKELKENNKSTIKSIKAAWGGYGSGENKAMEIIDDLSSRLKAVGVQTWIIGHVKTKSVTDAVSGENYQILTSDQQQNYFNHIKKQIDILAIAYFDREMIKVKTNKIDPKTKKEKIVNKIASEARKIKFRDDNYAVDSGSRFAEIVSEIDMSADNFIAAINDAIKAEQQKSGVSYSEYEKKQKKEAADEEKRIAQKEKQRKYNEKLSAIISEIADYCKENKTNTDVLSSLMTKCKDLGYDNPANITDIEDAQKLLDFIKE